MWRDFRCLHIHDTRAPVGGRKTDDDLNQMADEEKFERTIAILGRLLRDDLQLQVIKREKVENCNFNFLSAGSLPYACHDDPLPEGST